MKALFALALIFLLPVYADACDFSKASYVYTGAKNITAKFEQSEKIPISWLTNRYIKVIVGDKKLFFLFDKGSAKQISLMSSMDPNVMVPTPDGGVRPYGDLTFISWDKENKVDTSIPINAPPEYFLIPELAERLAHGPGLNDQVMINPGIFELRCR